MRVSFVLRGRPGLGHVVPGAALAIAMAERGHEVTLVSYDNGPAFLQSLGLGDPVEIAVSGEYEDYPGLTLYDDGLRRLVPHLREVRPDLVVLGGEYVLGAMASVWPCKTAMLVNPEIFEAGPRNREVAAFFDLCFRDVEMLIPLRPYQGGDIEPSLAKDFARLGTAGPFRIQDVTACLEATEGNTRSVVISIGGGMSFPRSTASYSDDAVSPERWRVQTMEMAEAATRAALARLGPADTVFVFGVLDADAFRRGFGNDARLVVSAPDARYYSALSMSDLAVLRSGAGALADLDGYGGRSIVWPLLGHPEQHQNAAFAKDNFGSDMVTDAGTMASAVARGLDLPRPAHRAGHPSSTAVAHVCEMFEEAAA